MKFTYKHTVYACFVGYIVQAVVNNFVPLLFLTFQSSYDIPLSQITLLVTFNFGVQLITDFAAALVVERVGYRPLAVLAHVAVVVGLVSMVILPEVLPVPFIGLLVSVMLYAIGGGLTEVVISPIVEACPTDNKEGAMSLLHSFYCWGHVGVVLVSTVFFTLFGIENWRILALIWALIPFVNTFFFMKVPIASLLEEGDSGLSVKSLLSNKMFWLLAVLMVCSGASEQAVSQWASTFAELGLGVGKTLGDLLGPMLFAAMMGMSRLIYGKFSPRMNLHKTMMMSAGLCIASYLLISLTPYAALGLVGCGICGFSVGILWPGTFSIASAKIPRGAAAMFAYLALAGDLGCALGPTVTGRVAGLFSDNLKIGILFSIVFPLVMLAGVAVSNRQHEKSKK